MELLDKVRLIIGNKCESPSQFADEIGIPRSAVSHLLNGRNKPSLDVVGKIIRRYPDLGADWIWDDEKMPHLNAGITDRQSSATSPKITRETVPGKPLDLFSQANAVPEPMQENVRTIRSDSTTRKVERVLLFYSDGTFEEFGIGS
ncbi:helix-turn-helix transcriptional regulator [Ravibacter arvi]|uniref:Helix-turn-helix transcriptional regulator n=1 Tax=Ravibacter arvi TaxID=2051041 RepID=A0ABP8LP69_9BACT